TDGTVELAEASGLRVLKGKDKGIFDAINKGSFQSSGELLGFLGADDVMLDGALEAVVRTYRESGRRWVVGGIRWIDERGRSLGELAAPPRWMTPRMHVCLGWNPIMHMGTYFSREFFTELGGFNIDYRDSGDYEMFARALSRAPYARLARPDACFRRTGMHNSAVNSARTERENGTVRDEFGPKSAFERRRGRRDDGGYRRPRAECAAARRYRLGAGGGRDRGAGLAFRPHYQAFLGRHDRRAAVPPVRGDRRRDLLRAVRLHHVHARTGICRRRALPAGPADAADAALLAVYQPRHPRLFRQPRLASRRLRAEPGQHRRLVPDAAGRRLSDPDGRLDAGLRDDLLRARRAARRRRRLSRTGRPAGPVRRRLRLRHRRADAARGEPDRCRGGRPPAQPLSAQFRLRLADPLCRGQ